MKSKSVKNKKLVSVAHFDRDVVLAKVEDWLPKKLGIKILRIVNSNGGVVYVNDDKEQLKILFPAIRISTKDPRKILGLILDQDKGWVICSFNYSKDRAKSSMLTGIIKHLGYSEDVSLMSTLYKVFVSAPQDQSPGDLINLISLLIRVTRFNAPGYR